MKKLIWAYLIYFCFLFMCYIYEPIMMYATNMNDFWFDFGIMITPVLKIFLILYLVGCLFYTLIYFISNKCLKKINIFYVCLILTFIAFILTYIQGNYLIGNLPSLDGSVIDWSIYKVDNLITLGIWLCVIVGVVIACKKLKLEKMVKYSTYISLAVFLMLSVSLCTTLINTKAYKNKDGIYFTNENINTASSNKNFFIFLIDSVNSDTLYKEWEKDSKYEDLFNDFTFYNNALSTYAYTRDSIPQILTGKINRNELEFAEFSSAAYNDSYLFDMLQDKDYEMNIYDYQIVWNGQRNYDIKNVVSSKNSFINLVSFFKQETKYILFKYVPYGLKKYSKIDTMDFDLCIEKFRRDINLVHNMINFIPNLEITDANQFQFVHTDGAHVSFDFDENLTLTQNGTYKQEVHGNLKLLKAFLDRLKNNKVYDNSVIVLMADHGYNEKGGNLERFNPFLAIKGVNEKHDMIISDLPVSFEDLQDAFTDLLNDKKSVDLFKNVPEKRERKVLEYTFMKEDHMVEYKTTGKANDSSKFKKTGKVFDR